MASKQFIANLTRKVGQRTNDEIVKKQLLEIIRRGMTGGRGNGWEFSISRAKPAVQDENKLWVFERKVTFKKTKGHSANAEEKFYAICKVMMKAGQGSQFKQYPWLVSGKGLAGLYDQLSEEGKVAPFADKPTVRIMEKKYGEINTDPGHHFDHIFGRKPHVQIIMSAIEAAISSDLENRFHCVLQGPPGCGKTDILASVGRMLGKENQAYMMVDATSATEAGMQRILLESAYIPPVLIIEEIEKTDEKALRWLLGVLDHRAKIRKTNFHIGHRARNVKMLCLATVNNIKLFKKVMSGALFSRFAHEIYCPRPTREEMFSILEREVAKISGDKRWIEPTLQYCMDDGNINDPRKIIPVCLCGRNDLLDGSYQKALSATKRKRKKRNEHGVLRAEK